MTTSRIFAFRRTRDATNKQIKGGSSAIYVPPNSEHHVNRTIRFFTDPKPRASFAALNHNLVALNGLHNLAHSYCRNRRDCFRQTFACLLPHGRGHSLGDLPQHPRLKEATHCSPSHLRAIRFFSRRIDFGFESAAGTSDKLHVRIGNQRSFGVRIPIASQD